MIAGITNAQARSAATRASRKPAYNRRYALIGLKQQYGALLTDPETFEAELRGAQRVDMDKIRHLREQLEHPLQLIAEVEREADELGRALGKAVGIVGQSSERQIEEINQR